MGLDSAHLQWSGVLTLNGLAVHNPGGFKDPVFIGVPKEDVAGTDKGAIHVFESVVKTNPPFFRIYGAACAGSNGTLPRLRFAGRPALGASFDIDLASALPSTAARAPVSTVSPLFTQSRKPPA